MNIVSKFFSSSQEKNELVLIFYFGSSSVGGALFWMQKSGVPKIVFDIREPIILEKNIDIDRSSSLTIKALETVVGRVYAAGMGAPQMIFCVLSSLWYVSQTRIINLQKNTPFTFSTKLSDDLIQKEIALFKEENLSKYTNNIGGSGIRLIEFKNIKTMLNGYETLNPLNQKAKELEMTVFISMSGEQFLKKIEETIEKHFHFKDIKFSSSLLSSFIVTHDMYKNQENFLLMNIGGELTDISMIKKNILCESISFPLGINFMIRGISDGLNCSLDEAKSLLSLLKDDHAENQTMKKIEPIINKLKNEWLVKFQKSLSDLSNDISIPATIYLIIDKDLAYFFSEIIKNEQFNQYTLTDSKFKIIFLSVEIFHGLAQFEENIIRDTFLIINSIYINRFFNKSTLLL